MIRAYKIKVITITFKLLNNDLNEFDLHQTAGLDHEI